MQPTIANAISAYNDAAKRLGAPGIEAHSAAATLSLRGHQSSKNSSTWWGCHHPRSPSA